MRMRTFLARLPILGLSFVLAMTLYLFVQVQSSPNKGPIPIQVKLNTSSLSSKFYAYVLSTVKVSVEGPTEAVDQFISDRGKVMVDVNLASAKTGTYDYLAKLEVPPNSPLHFSMSDHYIKVRIVPMAVRTNVKVVDVWTGQMSASSEFFLSDFELKPSTVTLRGPEDRIDLAKPTVSIDLSHVSSSSDFMEVPVQALDHKGALVDGVSALPAVVEASPILLPKPQLKQIVLNIQFVGHLVPGLSLKTWTISPQAVTVHGPSEALAKLIAANVTVDLSKLTNAGWNEVDVVPTLPAGITLARHQVCTVKVQLAPQPVPTNNSVITPPPSKAP